MATLNEKTGEIVLSTEEKEMFAKVNYNVANKKTPTSDRIMKRILQDLEINKQK